MGDMTAEEKSGCPYPGVSEGSGPADTDSAAPGCPAPDLPAGTQWEIEAHIMAMRKARASAATSHVSTDKAEQMAQNAVEQRAIRRGVDEISTDFVDALGKKLGYGHPLSHRTGLPTFTWTPEAEERLMEVPAFCRELTRWRVEFTAIKKGLGNTITPAIMDVKYQMWGEVSHAIQGRHQDGLPWTETARRRFDTVPEFVRGQVLEAIEGNARTMGAAEVDDSVVDRVIERWSTSGDFHEGLYGFR
jgi:hypothetical protein